jgi:hypothetical protein
MVVECGLSPERTSKLRTKARLGPAVAPVTSTRPRPRRMLPSRACTRRLDGPGPSTSPSMSCAARRTAPRGQARGGVQGAVRIG